MDKALDCGPRGPRYATDIFFSVLSANPKSRRKVTSCPLEGTKAVSPGGLGLNRLCLLQDIIRYHYAKHIRGDNKFFSDRDIFLL